MKASWGFLLILIQIAISGCAGPQGQRESPPQPSEATRTAIRRIAIVCENDPQLEMRKAKNPGDAAAEGALGGFLSGAGVSGGGSGDFAGAAQVLVWAVTIPVGTVAGAIGGWNEGVSKEEIEKAQRELKAAVDETAFSQTLRARLLAEGVRNTHYSFAVPAVAPDAKNGSARYKQFAAEGVDTVVEVNLLNVGLAGAADANPELSVFVRARTRLVRVSDEAELYSYTWVQSGGSRKFTEWGDDHARLFREQLERLTHSMAENVIEELFLVHRAEK